MRYYFDIFDGDHWTRDDLGVECRDDRAARYQAVLALTEMSREYLPDDGNEMELLVKVRQGEEVRFKVRIAFTVEGQSR